MTYLRDGMRVKHGTKFKVTVLSGDKILQTDEVDATLLGAHFTVVSAMYNANPYSGGGLWHNPSTGQAIARPKLRAELIDPTDELTGDQECDCERCDLERANDC